MKTSNAKDLLIAIAHNKDSADQRYLVDLIAYIRPDNPHNFHPTENKITEIINILISDKHLLNDFRVYIKHLLQQKNYIRLLCELGISSNPDFFSELFRRINEKILPPLIDKVEMMDLLEDLFSNNKDYIWVEKIPDEIFIQLFDLIHLKNRKNKYIADEFLLPLTVSIKILANRISALGLEKELIARLPHIEKYQSSFISLPQEVFLYIELIKAEAGMEEINEKYEQVIHIIRLCKKQLEQVRGEQKEEGVSIKLVYLILRIAQNLERLQELIFFTYPNNASEKKTRLVKFLKDLVRHENKKHGLKEHFKSNTDMLAYQIIEHTGHTGEHYITNTPQEYFKFLWKSMGGGLVICLVTWIKYIISFAKFPALTEAFWFSTNYAIGFVAIYVPGFTLATKQPAMTASALASSLDTKKNRVNISNAADLVVKMARSQFVSFLGNLLIVIPIGYLIAYLYHYFTGDVIVHSEKALKTLIDNNAFTSLCVFYGGITGVFLFLSGLISGYYDNKVDYQKIPERIRAHKGLNRLFSQLFIQKASRYIDNHLGGIAGNVSLGLFLGLAPTIGDLTGLPLDVRHITLSGCSAAMSYFTLGGDVNNEILFGVITGICGIGIMNFAVSFGLTLFVAAKSRKLNFTQTGELISAVFARFLSGPGAFFYPPIKRTVSLQDKSQKTDE